MKLGLVIALLVAIVGQVLYHVAQKSVASEANPVISLLVFYFAAALLTLPLLALYPIETGFGVELFRLNWAVFAVAGSIVLIEIGFLLAYRAGGSLSTTYITTAAVVTAGTLVVGVLVHKESVSLIQAAGIAMCLGGIALMSWKSA